MELWQKIQEASNKDRRWLSEQEAREIAVAATNHFAEKTDGGGSPPRRLQTGNRVMVLEPGEPVFVIRAKDNYGLVALHLLSAAYQIEEPVFQAFKRWRREHPTMCKDPG